MKLNVDSRATHNVSNGSNAQGDVSDAVTAQTNDLENVGQVGPYGTQQLSQQARQLQASVNAQMPMALASALSALGVAMQGTQSIAQLVGATAAQLQSLWDDRDLQAMGVCLQRFASQPALRAVWTPQDLHAVHGALLRHGLVVRAHILGVLHHAVTNIPTDSPLGCWLRHDDPQRQTFHVGTVAHYAMHFCDPAKRAEAFKATLVHLSWLAPAWRPMDSIQRWVLGQNLQEALRLLFQQVHEASCATTDADKAAFVHDVLAAFVPACCSPLLSVAMTGAGNVPPWLDDDLLAAREQIASDAGVQLFPTEQRVRQLGMAQTLQRADLPVGMHREVVFSWVKTTAEQVGVLSGQGNLAGLQAVLTAFSAGLLHNRTGTAISPRDGLVLEAIPLCELGTQGHLLGSLHRFETQAQPSDPLMRRWRFAGSLRKVALETVVQARTRDIAALQTRAEALKGTMSQLSWLAAAWTGWDDQGFPLLVSVLRTAFARAKGEDERHALLRDVSAALAPAYCSPWLVSALKNTRSVPTWLFKLLRTAEQNNPAGQNAGLFPLRPAPPVQPRGLAQPMPLSLQDLSTARPLGAFIAFRPEWRIVSTVLNASQEIRGHWDRRDLAALHAALRRLAQSLVPDAAWQVPTILAILSAMDLQGHVVGSLMRGGLHHFHVDAPTRAPWRALLRRDQPGNASFVGVALHLQANFRNDETRAEAVLATVVHLGWLAPAWTEMQEIDHLGYLEALTDGLNALFQELDDAYPRSGTPAEQAVFLHHVLAAFEPECCSLLLASALDATQDIPLWLEGALGQSRKRIVAASMTALFPGETRVRATDFSRLGRSDMNGWTENTIAWFVDDTARTVLHCLDHNQPVELHRCLRQFAHALAHHPFEEAMSRNRKWVEACIHACDPTVASFMLGSLHFLLEQVEATHVWARALRLDSPQDAVSLAMAVQRRERLYRDPAKRLKARWRTSVGWPPPGMAWLLGGKRRQNSSLRPSRRGSRPSTRRTSC